MSTAPVRITPNRLPMIEQARRVVLGGESGSHPPHINAWIERSWRRCLEHGFHPDQRVSFNAISPQAARRTAEAAQPLVRAARPVLDQLSRAIAGTRYFAVLTDAQGIVIDVNGPVDSGDRRATLIARIGVDLSERAVGTTAIGAALSELEPVWLHRGEHFFNDTSVYSCAGAPLFGPGGQCIGMLDLTGVEVPERPELKHLVSLSARSIEHGLLMQQPHTLMLHVNWPGSLTGDERDGIVCVDAEGFIRGSNLAARQMLPLASASHGTQDPHCHDIFAIHWTQLFDMARRSAQPVDVPLWSGLHLLVLAQSDHRTSPPLTQARLAEHLAPMPLKDVQSALIRKAVDDARGNVAEAARALGISRATVYRRLAARHHNR